MKRAVFTILATVVGLVMLLQYRTPAPPAMAIPVAGATAAGAGTTPPAAAPPATPAGPSPEQARTLVGETIDTEQGLVQVQVTITGTAATGTTITDITVLQYPNGGGRDQEINSAARPQLVEQALAVQGSGIQTVSGATYTHLDRIHPIPAERTRSSMTAKHAEHGMGTVFSVHVVDEPGEARPTALAGVSQDGDWQVTMGEVVDFLHWVDQIFSTYRSDSQISRLGRGELRVCDCDAAVGECWHCAPTCRRSRMATSLPVSVGRWTRRNW